MLVLCLSLTIWYSGAPLAVALAGIFVYRVLALWLPIPPSLALLPALRRMGEQQVAGAEDQAEPPDEPALRRGA